MALPKPFHELRADLPAGLVVFLVALPLCLGIAFASGTIDGVQHVPPLAGLVSGITGGLVIAWLSGSHTSVSGPAAGLIVMVVEAVRQFGYEGLLTITVIAGVFQLLFGVARFGKLGQWFPTAVIKGMLVAIGLILVLKQIPHAFGYDGDFEGDIAFQQADGRNTLTEIPFALGHMHVGALLIAATGLFLILIRDKIAFLKKRAWLPGPLLAVLGGVALNELFHAFLPSLALTGDFLVTLPTGGPAEVFGALSSPNWELISQGAVWISGLGIAVVASVETLLCAEAVDELDPLKRTTPSNRELFAQGAGNIVAGLLGGIPITAVIVRGSANIHSGARTRMSSFFHGILLLVAVLVAAKLINRIPLAALAAILLHIGYRLAHPKNFRDMARRAPDHWVPFFATVTAIMFTDLLVGIGVGFALAIVFILVRAFRLRSQSDNTKRLLVGPIVPPLSRFAFRRALADLPEDSVVVIDVQDSDRIDEDVNLTLEQLQAEASKQGVEVQLLRPSA